MKKLIFVIALFALSFSAVQAQVGDFRFGFQASPTLSWTSANVNYVSSNGTIPGLKLGVLGEYYFRPDYAFIGGLCFGFNTGGRLRHEFQGTYWTETEKGIGIDTLAAGVNLKYNLQYVEIPFGLKMRTREFGYLRYFAEIPVFTLGFESTARGTISAGPKVSDDPQAIEDLNIKNEINAIALSWGFGGGAEYSLSQTTSIVAGIFYQKYFTDVTDDNGTTQHNTLGFIPNNEKTTISNLTLRLGVIF